MERRRVALSGGVLSLSYGDLLLLFFKDSSLLVILASLTWRDLPEESESNLRSSTWILGEPFFVFFLVYSTLVGLLLLVD